MAILQALFGNGPETTLDIDVGITVSGRCLDPLDVEQWNRVVDMLWDNGVRHLVIISDDMMSDDILKIVNHARKFDIGLIIPGREVSPEMAMALARLNIRWVEVIIRDMLDREVQGLKNALAAGLNVTGVVSPNIDMIDRRPVFAHFGVDSVIIIENGEYSVDMLIKPDGVVICSGKRVGNVFMENWADLMQQK
jgi:hypothetical protein